jgi:hypothetical protein
MRDVANVGESTETVKATCKRLLPGHLTEGDDEHQVASREMELIKLASVWQVCHARTKATVELAARSVEDPNKVPLIPTQDWTAMRSNFKAAHPESRLDDDCEPHRKWISTIKQDMLVTGRFRYFDITEVRVASDSITQVTGWKKTIHDLPEVSNVDLPATVAKESSVIDRVLCRFYALDWVQVMPWTVERGIAYMEKIRQLHRDHPGLPVLLKLDQIFWTRLDQRLRDDRTKTFPQAFDEQVREWDAVRNTAVIEVHVHAKVQPGRIEAADPGRTAPQERESQPSRRALKRRVQRERDQQRKTQKVAEDKAARKGRNKGSGKGKDKGRRGDQNKENSSAPTDAEDFAKLDNVPLTRKGVTVCKFFQLRSGCNRGADCKYVHECANCPGQAHAYCDQH